MLSRLRDSLFIIFRLYILHHVAELLSVESTASAMQLIRTPIITELVIGREYIGENVRENNGQQKKHVICS